MVSQQLIIQCDVCSVLFTYQKKSQYLKNEERYGKTIHVDGIPLLFQEFFPIRQTSFSFHIHFNG